MKRIKHIYDKIFSFENLLAAHQKAKKNKRYRQEILQFTEHLEENLIEIQNELIWKMYKVGEYRKFFVYEPTKRLVMALPYKDRVVQWAIYRQLKPLIEKRYISTSFACRIDGGSHRAVLTVQRYMRYIKHRYGDVYILKLDVAKYFYRVDHKIIMNIFKKVIADKDLLELLQNIVDADECFGLDLADPRNFKHRVKDVGMPIGNLTSQMIANLYLNELDQYAKHVIKTKCYVRYMDDIIIVGHDKQELWKIKQAIELLLWNKLHLVLNNKTRIQTINQGLDFCGYRIWLDHIRLRKATALRAKRKVKKLYKKSCANQVTRDQFNSSLQSYLGTMKHADCYNLQKTVLGLIQKGESDG